VSPSPSNALTTIDTTKAQVTPHDLRFPTLPTPLNHAPCPSWQSSACSCGLVAG